MKREEWKKTVSLPLYWESRPWWRSALHENSSPCWLRALILQWLHVSFEERAGHTWRTPRVHNHYQQSQSDLYTQINKQSNEEVAGHKGNKDHHCQMGEKEGRRELVDWERVQMEKTREWKMEREWVVIILEKNKGRRTRFTGVSICVSAVSYATCTEHSNLCLSSLWHECSLRCSLRQ